MILHSRKDELLDTKRFLDKLRQDKEARHAHIQKIEEFKRAEREKAAEETRRREEEDREREVDRKRNAIQERLRNKQQERLKEGGEYKDAADAQDKHKNSIRAPRFEEIEARFAKQEAQE